jgi:hypothetical protein
MHYTGGRGTPYGSLFFLVGQQQLSPIENGLGLSRYVDENYFLGNLGDLAKNDVAESHRSSLARPAVSFLAPSIARLPSSVGRIAGGFHSWLTRRLRRIGSGPLAGRRRSSR